MSICLPTTLAAWAYTGQGEYLAGVQTLNMEVSDMASGDDDNDNNNNLLLK
jgi:hypothetical protein